MDLNDYCPAFYIIIITVSQICILRAIPSIVIFLHPNYTPKVGSCSFLNLPSTKRFNKQDLPTPEIMNELLESPMSINLNK
jgi:hypothetical protein